MRLAKLMFALAAGLLAVSPAPAQPPRGGAGGFGGGFGGGLANAIARSKPLQEELKVDADQLEKLTAALTKAREESRELTQKLFSRDTPMEERAEIGKKVQELNEKALASALKPEQVKRLKQIENQQAGLGVFNRPDVIEALKLTDEQKEKIAALNRELANDRRELMGSARGGAGGGGRRGAGGAGGGFGGFGRLDPEVTKKLESLTKEAMASAVKVLTDEQKTTYKNLTGEPFELPPGTLGFGGFGGGGGFGQPGGFGGGFGGFGGGTPPGTVLSANAQEQLKLTDEQKKELERIQKEVDAQLDKLLTEEQRKQFQEMRDRQPGRGRAPRKKGD